MALNVEKINDDFEKSRFVREIFCFPLQVFLLRVFWFFFCTNVYRKVEAG